MLATWRNPIKRDMTEALTGVAHRYCEQSEEQEEDSGPPAIVAAKQAGVRNGIGECRDRGGQQAEREYEIAAPTSFRVRGVHRRLSWRLAAIPESEPLTERFGTWRTVPPN